MMNKQILFKKIGYIISEITEQYQFLSENPEKLNELELELFSANSHFLSEHISILNKINSSQESHSLLSESSSTTHLPDESVTIQLPTEFQQIEKEIITEIEAPAMVSDSSFKLESGNTHEEKPENWFSSDAEENSDLTNLSESTDLEPELLEEEIPFILERKPEPKIETPVEVKKEIPVENHQPVTHTAESNGAYESAKPHSIKEQLDSGFADENHKVPTINDLLSARNPHETVATQFRNNYGHDLKSLINLNDKLLFVKDLFNGYSLAYSEAIELLNRFHNFEEADKFLQQNYARKNNWGNKQSSADKFYEVLNRRFS
jgi:hypothetical protein